MSRWRVTCVGLVAAALVGTVAPARVEVGASGASHRLTVEGERFLLDGQPFLIRSGEMHYPRVPRAYWRDRMRRLRALGLNTLTTYVFWNVHEPVPGAFDFSGDLDVATYVRTAQEEGLWVILRPGPYVCTEWDLGGLPSWLLREPGMALRSADPRFLAPSRRYLARLGRELAGLQATRGGPIILVQVENEYGSFGSDKVYLGAIRDQIRAAGFEVPLFTSDGPTDRMLAGGTLDDVLSVVNFAADDDPEEAFATFAKFRRGVPRMVGEFWTGWFDHWGRDHHVVAPEAGARHLDWLLGQGISVNLYMAHGGTTFGFLPGANWDTRYWPDTTGYDYDAPIDEAGRPTPKFEAYRAVFEKHLPRGERLPPVPAALPAIAIPRVELPESAPLAQLLSTPIRSERPLTQEAIGQEFGFTLYRTRVDRSVADVLEVIEVRDYAVVLSGTRVLGTLDRRLRQGSLDVRLAAGDDLGVLVENMGRVNFGPRLLDDRKGITEKVTLGGRELTGFEIFPLSLRDLSGLRFAREPVAGPAFHRGTFDLSTVGDTFLDLRGWGKGVAWVNGRNLGRFWWLGPQRSLYCPAPFLRQGRNEIVVLETDDRGHRTVQGLVTPVYTAAGIE